MITTTLSEEEVTILYMQAMYVNALVSDDFPRVQHCAIKMSVLLREGKITNEGINKLNDKLAELLKQAIPDVKILDRDHPAYQFLEKVNQAGSD